MQTLEEHTKMKKSELRKIIREAILEATIKYGTTKGGEEKVVPKKHWEVAPPRWGHTVAKKEKTKPSKPKSKIGGTAAAMKRAQARGDIPKDMNIFALMWSMKNKADKPHYKPGTDKKYKKYKKK